MADADMTRRRVVAGAGMLAAGAALAQARASEGRQRRSSPNGSIPVAVLLGRHSTLIDFAGPFDVLGAAAYACAGFDLYTVAPTRDPVLCDDGRSVGVVRPPISGLHVVPDYTLEDAPQPRIVLMGAQLGDDEAKVAWIRKVAPGAELVASVCAGAFLLAKTGLLDGQRATTNRTLYDRFETTFPKVSLVRDVRFVDNGRTATATGLTAGIDLAVHLVERFYGAQAARKTSLYEEWAPRPRIA